ncbi:MAG TPA: hypothetical protein VGK74_25445 [Symbiobacteriaceae bacterium]
MALAKQFARGLAYGILLDGGWVLLFWLLSGWSLAPWVLVLAWAMAVLAVTGAGLVESRWLQVAGFWLVHLAVFTAGLMGLMTLLKLIYQARGT